MTRVSAIDGHALWASIYDEMPNPLLHLERRSMGALLDDLRPSVMIDVACGTGRWLLHFEHGGTKVFGIDACEPMLREAEKHLSLRGHFVLGAAEHLPFRSAAADLVLCSMSLGYFRDLPQIFREFNRVSMPGARIAVCDLHPAAIAAGWTRSFKRGERHYEIENRSHSLEEIAQAAATAGFRSYRQEVARIDDPEFSIFESTGKEKLFRTLTNTPAIFLSLWEKPC